MSSNKDVKEITLTDAEREKLSNDNSKVVLLTKDKIEQFIKDNDRVVVRYTTNWCKPCKRIDPFFKKLMQECKNISCVTHKNNVDKYGDELMPEGILAVPTFKFFFKGSELKYYETSKLSELTENMTEFNTSSLY